MVTALRLQTVRYGGDSRSLLRVVLSASAAVTQLRRDGRELPAVIAIADCGGPSGADDLLEPNVLEEARRSVERSNIGFEYLPLGLNAGHGGGQNRLAVSNALGDGGAGDEVLVFLNPDAYLAPGCLQELLRAFEDESVGIGEGRQIPLEHPKPFDLRTGDTPWASGCAMAIRRSLFESLGGFESAFFLQGDDVDLSWRVRLKGFRVCHLPQAVVFHDKRPEASGFPPPTAEEEQQAMLARFLLAYRAERWDVIDWWLDWAKLHASPLQEAAVADFQHRHSEGDLPEIYRTALDVPAESVAVVATFIGGEYAEHRF